MKDHWNIFDGPVDQEPGWLDLGIIVGASIIIGFAIFGLIDLLI